MLTFLLLNTLLLSEAYFEVAPEKKPGSATIYAAFLIQNGKLLPPPDSTSDFCRRFEESYYAERHSYSLLYGGAKAGVVKMLSPSSAEVRPVKGKSLNQDEELLATNSTRTNCR